MYREDDRMYLYQLPMEWEWEEMGLNSTEIHDEVENHKSWDRLSIGNPYNIWIRKKNTGQNFTWYDVLGGHDDTAAWKTMHGEYPLTNTEFLDIGNDGTFCRLRIVPDHDQKDNTKRKFEILVRGKLNKENDLKGVYNWEWKAFVIENGPKNFFDDVQNIAIGDRHHMFVLKPDGIYRIKTYFMNRPPDGDCPMTRPILISKGNFTYISSSGTDLWAIKKIRNDNIISNETLIPVQWQNGHFIERSGDELPKIKDGIFRKGIKKVVTNGWDTILLLHQKGHVFRWDGSSWRAMLSDSKQQLKFEDIEVGMDGMAWGIEKKNGTIYKQNPYPWIRMVKPKDCDHIKEIAVFDWKNFWICYKNSQDTKVIFKWLISGQEEPILFYEDLANEKNWVRWSMNHDGLHCGLGQIRKEIRTDGSIRFTAIPKVIAYDESHSDPKGLYLTDLAIETMQVKQSDGNGFRLSIDEIALCSLNDNQDANNVQIFGRKGNELFFVLENELDKITLKGRDSVGEKHDIDDPPFTNLTGCQDCLWLWNAEEKLIWNITDAHFVLREIPSTGIQGTSIKTLKAGSKSFCWVIDDLGKLYYWNEYLNLWVELDCPEPLKLLGVGRDNTLIALSEEGNLFLKTLAKEKLYSKSIVSIVRKGAIVATGPNTSTLKTNPLYQRINENSRYGVRLSSQTRFYDQPTAANSTGFIAIKKSTHQEPEPAMQYFMAKHSYEKREFEKYVLVLGFQKYYPTQDQFIVNVRDIFTLTYDEEEKLFYSLMDKAEADSPQKPRRSADLDLAQVTLSKDIQRYLKKRIVPIPYIPEDIRKDNGQKFNNTPILAMGHPKGLGLVYTPNGYIYHQEDFEFKCTIDAFQGNSGGPCLRAYDHILVGIMSRMDKSADYVPSVADDQFWLIENTVSEKNEVGITLIHPSAIEMEETT